MAGGTLLVNRDTKMFPFYKMRLEALGFPDVHVTGKDKDGLNMLINELKPGYVLFDSNFYYCGTPYMIGRLLSVFPKLNIAVITISIFPDDLAAWFIFHGVKTYIKYNDGLDVFYCGLKSFLNGKSFISPDVQEIIDNMEWPDVSLSETRRQKEILLMLCNGFSIKNIEDNLQISKATVEFHIRGLMKTFNCEGREELIKTVHCLDIFSKQDLCFSPEKHNKDKLPDWAKAQQFITKITNNRQLIKLGGNYDC
jgi:DNA-binding NarL/FixJ family response regulator